MLAIFEIRIAEFMLCVPAARCPAAASGSDKNIEKKRKIPVAVQTDAVPQSASETKSQSQSTARKVSKDFRYARQGAPSSNQGRVLEAKERQNRRKKKTGVESVASSGGHRGGFV